MVRLWEGEIPGYEPSLSEEIPKLTPYLIKSGKTHAAVIICPGGGYDHRAAHEGEPVAKWLNKLGVSAFVLAYRVAPYKHPYPLLDGKRAVRFLRYHAAQWQIDPDKILVLGFSAGGHLAAMVGTHFDQGDKKAADPVERLSSKPNGMILCYPVITCGEFRHQGSITNLLGDKPEQNIVDYLSGEKNVTNEIPPTFLWHTADDASVPVENTLQFAAALSKEQVAFEVHIFPHGRHGLGLADGNPEIAVWTELCAQWLKKMNFI